MALLIRDDPEWPMPGFHGQDSRRRLRVWRCDNGGLAAVITERGAGTSVTNVAQDAHAATAGQPPGEAVRVRA